MSSPYRLFHSARQPKRCQHKERQRRPVARRLGTGQTGPDSGVVRTWWSLAREPSRDQIVSRWRPSEGQGRSAEARPWWFSRTCGAGDRVQGGGRAASLPRVWRTHVGGTAGTTSTQPQQKACFFLEGCVEPVPPVPRPDGADAPLRSSSPSRPRQPTQWFATARE